MRKTWVAVKGRGIERTAPLAVAAALTDDGIAPDQHADHLARLTGHSVEDARAWLAGKRLPPVEVLQAIVGALDLPPAQLIGTTPLDIGARRLRALIADWTPKDRERLALVLAGVRTGDRRTEQIVGLLERGPDRLGFVQLRVGKQ